VVSLTTMKNHERQRTTIVLGFALALILPASCASTISSGRPSDFDTGPSRASMFGLGEGFSCANVISARDIDFGAWCWGETPWSRAGAGELAVRRVPLEGIYNVSGVTAGERHACAMGCAGRDSRPGSCAVYCWGANDSSQLGPNGPRAATAAVLVPIGGNELAVDAGGATTCVLLRTGEVLCWGANPYGQIGVPIGTNVATPRLIGGLPPVADLSVGASQVCAIARDRTLWCWGRVNPWRGRVGVDSPSAPYEVEIHDSIEKLSVGDGHACAISVTGALYCWGSNPSGQVGIGHASAIEGITQVRPPAGTRWTDISAGRDHTCGLVDDRIVYCWGSNASGQVSTRPDPAYLSPTRVDEIPPAVFVEAGPERTCALVRERGSLRCWGRNDRGQIGDGTRTARSGPVVISIP
jgi:alpha-tubulin suppressor-like RCC1 family protein